MGFFSWKTCDTNETIWNHHTDKCRPVYLLRPNGASPILEPSYDGYGHFGGMDAYEQLYLQNLHLLPRNIGDIRSTEERRTIGIALELGNYYQDRDTEQRWLIFHRTPLTEWLCRKKGFRFYPGHYDESIPEYGLSANKLIEQKRFLGPYLVRDLLFDGADYRPLKFSFDPDCVYEEQGPSPSAPNQGYFDWDDEQYA